MSFPYSYPLFHKQQNPLVPVDGREYNVMRKDLNYFMHETLKEIYKDERVVGAEPGMNTQKMLLFALAFLAAVVGFNLLEHPGWIAMTAFIGMVMFMATIAIPIIFYTDQGKNKRSKHRNIQQIKSYYLFQYSIMRKVNSYEDYCELVPGTDLSLYQKYLDKYL